jgi:hypothetical protein
MIRGHLTLVLKLSFNEEAVQWDLSSSFPAPQLIGAVISVKKASLHHFIQTLLPYPAAILTPPIK